MLKTLNNIMLTAVKGLIEHYISSLVILIDFLVFT